MKKLSAVLIVLFSAVSSTYAAWDMFPVIGEGKAQAKIAYYGGTSLKIRFSPAENFEIFGTGSVSYLTESSYGAGVRYQIIPNLSAYLDLGVPIADDESFGLVPGVQFSVNFGEKLALGVLAGLGIDTDAPNNEYDDNGSEKSGAVGYFGLSAELDYFIRDNLGIAVGANFNYDRFFGYKDREDLEIKDALSPYIGLFSAVDNIVVATAAGLRLNAKDKDGKDSVGLWGGVDVTVTF
jgi:hypothetical protein